MQQRSKKKKKNQIKRETRNQNQKHTKRDARGNTGGECWVATWGKVNQDGVTRSITEQTDKHMMENKDYIHEHTNKGNRWSEEGKEQVR